MMPSGHYLQAARAHYRFPPFAYDLAGCLEQYNMSHHFETLRDR